MNQSQQPPVPPKKTFPGAGKFDPINSTYKHEIYLTTGRKLTGYSKSLLFPEMQDKIVLLERVILRLFNNGYLSKSDKIEFYLKNLTTTDDLILTLFPTSYTFGNNATQLIFNERFNQFIEKFYLGIKSKNMVTKDLTHYPITKEQEQIFSLDYKRFKTERELINFITQKQKEGHEREYCMHFYRAYKEKYLTF